MTVKRCGDSLARRLSVSIRFWPPTVWLATTSACRVGSSLNLPYDAACSSVRNSTGMSVKLSAPGAAEGSSAEHRRRACHLC